MVSQCELCTATGQTAEELLRHYSTHFAPGSCKQCHKQIVRIDGQCYVLQLHNQGTCKHRHLLVPFVLDEFSDFGVIKTEIVSDDEPCEMESETAEHKNLNAEPYHAIETVEVQPFELIECGEIKIELEDGQEMAPELMRLTSVTCTNQKPRPKVERQGPVRKTYLPARPALRKHSDSNRSGAIGKITVIPEATERRTTARALTTIRENLMQILSKPNGVKRLRYFCDICGKDFSKNNTLKQHKKLHTQIIDATMNQKEVDELPCDQVLVKPSGERYLRKYKCSVCPKYLLTEDTLRSHMRAVHRRVTTKITSKAEIDQIPPEQVYTDALGDKHLREYSCDYCGKYFMRFTSLRGHLNKYHLSTTKNVSLTEEECKLYPPDQILIKPNGERLLKKFPCTICNKYFVDQGSSNKHGKTHDKIAKSALTRDEIDKLPPSQIAVSSSGVVYARKYKCLTCNKFYITKEVLRSHMRIHKRTSTAKILTEEDCKSLPANRIAIQKGEKLLREFKCELCDSYLLTKQTLKDHIREIHEKRKRGKPKTRQIVTEEESKQYPAGQVFLSSTGIRYLRKYQCDICQRYITTREALLTHMRDIHIRNKIGNADDLHPCETCGKAFKSVGALNGHKWSHSQAKRFMCTLCGKGFTNRPALEEHNNVHNGLKPFKCGECEKTFSKRQLLSVHQRVHTGYKPFKCHVAGCDRAYAHGSDLNRHLYGAHRIYKRKYECHICPRIFHEKKLLTKHLLSHD